MNELDNRKNTFPSGKIGTLYIGWHDLYIGWYKSKIVTRVN